MESRYRRTVSRASAVIPLALGAALVVFTLSILATQTLPPVGYVLGGAVVVFPGVFLVACSVWLLVGSLDATEVNRVVAWTLAGTLPLVALTTVLILYQQSQGIDPANPLATVTWVAGAGGVGGFCTGIYDVRHARHRTRLDETSKRLQAVIDTTPVAIIALDTDERVRTWNQAATEMFGYDAEEVLGEPYPLAPAEFNEEYRAYRERVDEGAVIDGIETRRRHKDGSLVDVEIWAAPVEQDGDITGHMITMADVTERLARERDLRLLKLAIEQAEDAVMITDEHGVIEYVNETFVEMSGYERREALGRTPRILKSGKHGDALYTDMWNTITSGDVWQSELVNQRKCGELFDVELTITPVKEDGEIRHFVAIERDISDRKHDQQRLNVLNRVLRHNVRNAVNVIQNNAALLEETVDDPDDLPELRAVHRRAEALASAAEKARTVERALDNDSTRPIEATRLVDGALNTVEIPDSLCLDVDVEEELWIRCDHTLETALAEAVRNAIAHVENDEQCVRIHAREGDGTVEIQIADEGPGIPPYERSALQNADESALTHASGLGLWQMKWIVESCGGEITVDDRDGTVITFTLPAADRRTDEPAEPPAGSRR